MEAKIGNKKVEAAIIVAIKESKLPVTIHYIAKSLNICWTTARSILYRMANEGTIESQETTKTPIFWVNKSTRKRKSNEK